MALLVVALSVSLLALPLPHGFCRALSMPFRCRKPAPRRAAASPPHRRAPLKEHDWEETVLGNLTVAPERVRGSELF